jgi:hypothetical protein
VKTTIEIADDLLARSRKLADRRGVTLRALVEEGLRLVLKTRAAGETRAFLLPTFGGSGLTERYRDAGLHRAILDSYVTPPDESPDPAAHARVHDRDRG